MRRPDPELNRLHKQYSELSELEEKDRLEAEIERLKKKHPEYKETPEKPLDAFHDALAVTGIPITNAGGNHGQS